MNHPIDPREMRQRIMRHVRYGDPISGERTIGSANTALASYVMRAADRDGFSGEDSYTVLAYNVLVENERLMKLLLDFHASAPREIFITPMVPA